MPLLQSKCGLQYFIVSLKLPQPHPPEPSAPRRDGEHCVKCCSLLFENWVYVVLENQQHPATEDITSVYFADYFTLTSLIAQSCFQTLNADDFLDGMCPSLLNNQLASYMAMSVSMLQIKKMLPKPTKSRMSEKYKDGLRQS